MFEVSWLDIKTHHEDVLKGICIAWGGGEDMLVSLLLINPRSAGVFMCTFVLVQADYLSLVPGLVQG